MDGNELAIEMSVLSSQEESSKRNRLKNWRRLGIIDPSKEKRHTHYPVPSNVKVSKELGKVMIIFVHSKKAVNELVDLNHQITSSCPLDVVSCVKARLALTLSARFMIYPLMIRRFKAKQGTSAASHRGRHVTRCLPALAATGAPLLWVGSENTPVLFSPTIHTQESTEWVDDEPR